MTKPIVAIVGRPNVGKSSLFNRLVQKRIAIVEDVAGITRDRLYAETEWSGRDFTLVDTGGIEAEATEYISSQVRLQAEIAVEEADVVLFIVDGRDGLTPDDHEVADLLRRSKKPTVLVVNKIDNLKMESAAWDFYALGIKDIYPASALHGLNIGDILDKIISFLPHQADCTADVSVYNKVAVVGKPNVGKSSLVNKIVGEERVIVSDLPGTTRDAIDTPVERMGKKYLLVDTAGLRRPTKIRNVLERYSVLRTLRAVERSDVVLVLIDAVEGVAEQDKRICGFAHEAGRGVILVINKWDLIVKDNRTTKEYEEKLRFKLPFINYAPLIFLSAKTGQRIARLFPLIDMVRDNWQRQVTTSDLNQVISDAVYFNPPPSRRGRQGKIYYASQTGIKPPSFLFFVNEPKLISNTYSRYLENKLRDGFDFTGTPIRLDFRPRR
jgi:GTP-binding protein